MSRGFVLPANGHSRPLGCLRFTPGRGGLAVVRHRQAPAGADFPIHCGPLRGTSDNCKAKRRLPMCVLGGAKA